MEQPVAFVLNHITPSKGDYKQLNLSTLAIVRSLGRRNIRTVLITPTERDKVSDSRHCSAVEICPFMYESERELVTYLRSLAEKYTEKCVLIPAIDECAYFVGKYYQELTPYYLLPTPDWDVIKRVNNKRFQYELADKLNIPTPETYFPKNIGDLEGLAASLKNYPYVIKPNVSFEWKLAAMQSKAKGKKGIKVDNPEALLASARNLFVPGYDFMVQEVIGGRDERLVTFLSYCSEPGVPDSYFVRKKIRQCPLDFGYCTLTESCHNPKVVEQSTELLHALKYHGISGIEWKLDPETEQYKLIEVNARAVNTTGCAMAAGVDLPAIAYFDAIGAPLPPVTDWPDGCRWTWLSMDFWAGRELIAEGNLSFWGWLKSVSGVKADAVFALDDLKLSLSYYSGFVRSLIASKRKKVLARKRWVAQERAQ